MKRLIFSAALPLAISGCARVPASVGCATAGTGPVTERVLIFGESWASRGKELPAFPATLARRRHHAVRACSVGYAGYHTRKQIDALHRDWTRASIEQLLGGKPSAVIFITGVNDAVLHRGAPSYVSDMTSLIGENIWSGAKFATVEIPEINMSPQAGFLSKTKRALYKYWNDGGSNAVIPKYRNALAQADLPLQIIPYRPFSRGYLAEPSRYAKDGIHLLPAEFQKYGAYIAANLR